MKPIVIKIDTKENIIDISSNGGQTMPFQVLYSKIKEAWMGDDELIQHDFPMMAITRESGIINDPWTLSPQARHSIIGSWEEGDQKYTSFISPFGPPGECASAAFARRSRWERNNPSPERIEEIRDNTSVVVESDRRLRAVWSPEASMDLATFYGPSDKVAVDDIFIEGTSSYSRKVSSKGDGYLFTFDYDYDSNS